MRFPLSWLKEFVSTTLPSSEIGKKLTMIGLEVDKIEVKGETLSPSIVVGFVVSTERHPNADRLTVAKVSDGLEEFQVVCGAPNCRPGIKTAFAKIGTELCDAEGSFVIKKSKLRGVESFGMLCSAKELSLGEESDGIIELPQEFEVGVSLKKAMEKEALFEISLTPNLNHAGSIMGVAREFAAALETAITLPQVKLKEGQKPVQESISIEIEDAESCPRYMSRVVDNVKVGPSPDWLKARLEACGIRSINNVVDVTNYVLLELGHPLHAFNYHKIDKETIVVRSAKEGEKLVTLDGKERVFESSMLLICDKTKPLAIAGIMGGANSEVGESTTKVVIEAACFNPASIRKTSKKLGFYTDASKKFERGVDPNLIPYALDRAAELIQLVAGGEIEKGAIDSKAKDFPELMIGCRLSRINELLGLSLSRGEVETIFESLTFTYQWDGEDQFIVSVPTFRNDIKAEVDLIEEVARLYGYDNIPKKPTDFLASSIPHVPIYLLEKTVRFKMLKEGLQEFLTCDLIGPGILDIVGDQNIPEEMFVKVLNPTSIEQSILRTSLLPGLLSVVKLNHDRQNPNLSGFEIGRIHWKDGEHYEEQSVLGLVLTGKSSPHHWSEKGRDVDFFDLKGIVENLLNDLGIHSFECKNLNLKSFHSGRQASFFVNGQEVGSIGEVHPAIQRRLDVPNRILFGEFNLQTLLGMSLTKEQIKPLPLYPSSERDWTVTIKKTVSYDVLSRMIKEHASPLLEEFFIKDVYLSEKIGEDFQNLTLHFVYRDPLKTIQNDTVDQELECLIKGVLKQLQDSVKS